MKGKPLINVLGVSATGAVFLLAHDYSDKFKTAMNIAEFLLKNIEAIGPYSVILVITDNVLIVRQREQSLKINTPTYFGSGVWFTH